MQPSCQTFFGKHDATVLQVRVCIFANMNRAVTYLSGIFVSVQ